MARLNPKRRRHLKHAALLQAIRNEHGPSHDDSAKLQRGPVPSSVGRFTSTRADKSGNVIGNALHTRPMRSSTHAPDWYKDGGKLAPQKGLVKRLPPSRDRARAAELVALAHKLRPSE